VIAYIDSSVLLRMVMRQRGALREWRTIDRSVASALVEVECLRTLDRLRLRAGLRDPEVASRRAAVFRLLESMEVVELDAQPLPTELGTLDAIHLATALLWRETVDADLVMATHDVALAMAARSSGLRVVGIN
jgi:predicted nucleic acid-binding protein